MPAEHALLMATPRLLVTAREAAESLAIWEKTLWSLTKAGELRAVKIGRSVRCAVADLEAFVAARKGGAR